MYRMPLNVTMHISCSASKSKYITCNYSLVTLYMFKHYHLFHKHVQKEYLSIMDLSVIFLIPQLFKCHIFKCYLSDSMFMFHGVKCYLLDTMII